MQNLRIRPIVATFACLWLPASASLAQPSPSPNYRKLAPGVETTVPPDVTPRDIVQWQSVPAVLAKDGLKWQPNFESQSRTLFALAERAEFLNEVYCLQFTFKPLRMIYVDVPQPSGKLQRKLLWYMVYRVSNTGYRRKAVQDADQTLTIVEADPKPVRFIPQFILETREEAGTTSKAYLDRVIPAAVVPIQLREDPARSLLTTVEMAGTIIPLSGEDGDQSVWGVAIWEDIDPSVDFLSIFVSGLTNAIQWKDPAGGLQPDDPPGKGREYLMKTLQLNFWRPGDEIREHENEIRFGTPRGMANLYGVDEGVDYQWIYR